MMIIFMTVQQKLRSQRDSTNILIRVTGMDGRYHGNQNPLVADGKAMIPDFLFERFGHKVYFEIVGFWTKEYLERKAAKLEVLFDSNDKDNKKR